MIPDEAVEAAAHALFEKELGRPMEAADEGLYAEDIIACREDARAALEAAAPHLLSHEREQTRLAHVDAVVNAQTVNRLEKELDAERKKVELLVSSQSRPAALVALAEAWQRGYERSEQDEPSCATVCGGCAHCMSPPSPNPYL